jgi:hypothetical protein
MKTYELICSKDAIGIDYSEIVHSDVEPEYWDCVEIADKHSCNYFCLNEINFDEIIPLF